MYNSYTLKCQNYGFFVKHWLLVCNESSNDGTSYRFGDTAEKWQAVYTILEAFGNSSTTINTNASHFSHVVSLDFDQAGQVASASIQVTNTSARTQLISLYCTLFTKLSLLLRQCCWRNWGWADDLRGTPPSTFFTTWWLEPTAVSGDSLSPFLYCLVT